MSIKFVNIKGQKKIRLDRMQFMDCWDVESGLAEACLKLPEGISIYDLFEMAENGSYQYLDLNYCAEHEEEIGELYGPDWDDISERDVKLYQAHKILETFFKEYTDLMYSDGIWIYISW